MGTCNVDDSKVPVLVANVGKSSVKHMTDGEARSTNDTDTVGMDRSDHATGGAAIFSIVDVNKVAIHVTGENAPDKAPNGKNPVSKNADRIPDSVDGNAVYGSPLVSGVEGETKNSITEGATCSIGVVL